MRRLPLVLLLAAFAACDRSVDPITLNPTDLAVTGTYALAQVNGHTLPFAAFVTGNDEWDLTSDIIVMGDDKTWSETTNYNVVSLATTNVTQQHTTTSGTYAIGSGVITFTRIDGGALTFTGSVTGTTLWVLFNGGQFTYSR
ncbi:MAG TPA: hypothetical protein VK636_06960 [Gemmatimonadaceae bacterium]|nr:hypothetical protein [Gemmatimonadaceae bacterium]